MVTLNAYAYRYETVRMNVSLKCQDTTEALDIMMQQHLRELGY